MFRLQIPRDERIKVRLKMSETKDIIENHIARVQEYILKFQVHLVHRGQVHDQSKLDEATELPFFEKYATLLKGCVYGSDEYKQYLKELTPALECHYRRNRHHPEHFENGLAGMNLIDLCEMFCDWIAAGEQHSDGGNIFRSIDINQKRFGYSDEVKSILINTAKLFKKET